MTNVATTDVRTNDSLMNTCPVSLRVLLLLPCFLKTFNSAAAKYNNPPIIIIIKDNVITQPIAS